MVAEKSAAHAVKAINKSRVLGIVLKELVQRENVSEGDLVGLLRTLKSDGLELAEMEIARLMNFARVSNRIEGQLDLFGAAPLDVRQMVFQCAGLLPEEAARALPQASHEMAPSAQAWKCCMDVQAKFSGLAKNASLWDTETRAEVRQSIDKTRQFLAGLVVEIERVRPDAPSPVRNLLTGPPVKQVSEPLRSPMNEV